MSPGRIVMRDHGPGFSEAMLAQRGRALHHRRSGPRRRDRAGPRHRRRPVPRAGRRARAGQRSRRRRGRDDRAAAGMSARLTLARPGRAAARRRAAARPPACRSRTAATTTPIVKPAGPQPRVDGLDAVAFPSTSSTAGRRERARSSRRPTAAPPGRSSTRARPTSARSISPTSGTGGRSRSASLLRTADGGDTWSPAGEPDGLVADERRLRERRRGLGHRVSGRERRRAGPRHARRAPPTAARAGPSSSPTSQTRSALSGGELVAGAGSKVLDSTDGGATWSTLLDAASGPVDELVHGDRPVSRPPVDLGAVPGRRGRRQPGLRRLHQRRCGRRLAAGRGRADAGRIRPGVRGRHAARLVPRPVRGRLRVRGDLPRPVPGLRPPARDGAAHAGRRDALGAPRRQRLRPDRPGLRRRRITAG